MNPTLAKTMPRAMPLSETTLVHAQPVGKDITARLKWMLAKAPLVKTGAPAPKSRRLSMRAPAPRSMKVHSAVQRRTPVTPTPARTPAPAPSLPMTRTTAPACMAGMVLTAAAT